MGYASLVGQIWSGDVALERPASISPLTGLLGAVMNAPVITLSTKGELSQPVAMMECTEVLPGTSLGDVLAEELGLDVPYGSLVLVQPTGFADAKDCASHKLGALLGNVILQMTHQAQSIRFGQEAVSPEIARSEEVSASMASLGHYAHLGAPRLQ